jgi:hypothetical protein
MGGISPEDPNPAKSYTGAPTIHEGVEKHTLTTNQCLAPAVGGN